MQIQVNTDNNIEGRDKLAEHVRTVVEKALKKVSSRVTRVEVHLTDENAKGTGPDDMRCVMEARVERHQPVAVTHHAETLNLAIDGAADKLERALSHLMGRMRDHR